jgi:hypothetical protein
MKNEKLIFRGVLKAGDRKIFHDGMRLREQRDWAGSGVLQLCQI